MANKTWIGRCASGVFAPRQPHRSLPERPVRMMRRSAKPAFGDCMVVCKPGIAL